MIEAILPLVFGMAWTLTALTLRWARRWHWLDEPNCRSSHTRPTPTLGGVAIVVSTILGGWLLPLPVAILYPLIGAAVVLLLLIMDDVGRPLGVAVKAGIQLAAAGVWVAITPALSTGMLLWGQVDGLSIALLVVVWMIAVVWLVGCMNVFNFMDGIDAISASQTLVAGMCMALMLAVVGGSLWAWPAILAAAAAGFLVFNLPPARLFMGDVGATFLGLCFGAIVLQAVTVEATLWVTVLPLVGYFYDTGLTLARRVARGDNILAAHRQHLYQRLVRREWSHGTVAAAMATVTALYGAAGIQFLHDRAAAGVLLALLALALQVAGSMYTWRENDA